MIGYRYFAYPGGEKDVHVTIRGNGSGTFLLYQQDKGMAIGRIQVAESKKWVKVTGEFKASKNIAHCIWCMRELGVCSVIQR